MGAFSSARDIFVDQLGTMRDAERTGGFLLATLADRVVDPTLGRLLRDQAQDSDLALSGVCSCLDELKISPLTRRSEIVDGMRTEFEHVVARGPSPPAMDIFAVVAALQYLHFAVGAYQGLLDWTEIMREEKCRELMTANLAMKQEGAQRLEQAGRRASEDLFSHRPE